MGTLLNRRRYMGGGASLPYDAEIEYIQENDSNGSWIDTGFVPNQDTSIELKILLNKGNCVARFYEVRPAGGTTNSYGFINFSNSSNQLQIRYNGSQKIISSLAINTEYILKQVKGDVYIDGVYYHGKDYQTVTPTRTLVLFALHRSATVSVDEADNNFRLYYCKIWDNNVLVRDYIPVRIGQEGCLYDKLNGQIYHNGGARPFVLGPDKT